MGKRSRKKNRQKFRKKNKKKSRKIKKSKKNKKIIRKNLSLKDDDGNTIFQVSEKWAKQALVNKAKYKKKYNLSIKENDRFWKKEGKRISWIKPYTKIKDIKYSKDDVKIKWFYDGTLNASANCIDRHIKKNGKKTAIIWIGDDPSVSKKISYKELHKNVCKAANALKSIGVKKETELQFI